MAQAAARFWQLQPEHAKEFKPFYVVTTTSPYGTKRWLSRIRSGQFRYSSNVKKRAKFMNYEFAKQAAAEAKFYTTETPSIEKEE